MKYILDSNAFDYIYYNQIDIKKIKEKGEYYTCNVQKSELMNTPDVIKRKALLEIYEELEQEKLDSENGVWIDDLIWDDDEKWCDEPTTEFVELQSGKFKDSKDALIGALAKRKNIILVSIDIDFKKKCDKYGIKHITPEELFGR